MGIIKDRFKEKADKMSVEIKDLIKIRDQIKDEVFD